MESDEAYARAEEIYDTETVLWESLNADLLAIQNRMKDKALTMRNYFDVDKLFALNKGIIGIEEAIRAIDEVILKKESV